MSSTTLLQRPSMTVSDFRCTAVPGDKPFVELHQRHSISFVRKGSFGYHCRGCAHELVVGSLLIGAPGTEFICTHDHVCGDECLSFFFEPELVETIGERAEAWQVGATPPLAELMVLGELAQAAADGQSDIGLDEVGHLLASRLVEVVSRKPKKPARSKASGRSVQLRVRPSFWVATRFASTSRRMCFLSQLSDMPKGSASSLIVALPWPSRSRTARRVGSARAAKARSTVVEY